MGEGGKVNGKPSIAIFNLPHPRSLKFLPTPVCHTRPCCSCHILASVRKVSTWQWCFLRQAHSLQFNPTLIASNSLTAAQSHTHTRTSVMFTPDPGGWHDGCRGSHGRQSLPQVRCQLLGVVATDGREPGQAAVRRSSPTTPAGQGAPRQGHALLVLRQRCDVLV